MYIVNIMHIILAAFSEAAAVTVPACVPGLAASAADSTVTRNPTTLTAGPRPARAEPRAPLAIFQSAGADPSPDRRCQSQYRGPGQWVTT